MSDADEVSTEQLEKVLGDTWGTGFETSENLADSLRQLIEIGIISEV